MPIFSYIHRDIGANDDLCAFFDEGGMDQPYIGPIQSLLRLIPRPPDLIVASSTYAGPADYRCDGVADNVQIQAAIDALGSTGGTVVLTAGTFNLANAGTINDAIITPYCVKIDQNNGSIWLRGQGREATKLFLANGQPTNTISLLIRGSSTVNRSAPTRISDLSSDGNASNQPAWTDFASLEIAYADNVTIENCLFKNGVATAQCYRNSRNFAFINNRIEAGPNAALRIESGPGVVSGNTFYSTSGAQISGLMLVVNADVDIRSESVSVTGNTFEMPYNCLRISGGRSNTITGNTFRNVIHGTGVAVIIEGYSGVGRDYSAEGNVILGNTFYNCRNGILLSVFGATANACSNTLIAHNILTKGALTFVTGINEASVNNANTQIHGNIITGATTAIVTTSGTTVVS